MSAISRPGPAGSTSIAADDNAHRKAVFHVHDVSKVYRMGEVEVHALRGIDLDLYEGELVVLLGASGSGKSTLLNILGGLDVPSSGEVRYLDHSLTSATEQELTRFRREHVGFVLVMKIPSNALFRKADGWAVFVADGRGARLRPVKPGHAGPLETEILEGLAAGDRIVLHPSNDIADGTRIRIRQ